jgi:hypothetical protein
MVLKLAFKTAFPYGFSAFFIDTRLVNRVGTASLVRSAAAEADIPPSSEHSASLHSAYRVDTAGRVIPPSRYNRPWRPLDWRNSIEVSIRLAFSMCSYVNRDNLIERISSVSWRIDVL